MNASTVAAAADKVAAFARNRTQVYQGPVMIVWGGDFRFVEAQWMFGNMSYIVDYMNANQDIYNMHLQFATLSNVRAIFRTSHAVFRPS